MACRRSAESFLRCAAAEVATKARVQLIDAAAICREQIEALILFPQLTVSEGIQAIMRVAEQDRCLAGLVASIVRCLPMCHYREHGIALAHNSREDLRVHASASSAFLVL